MVWCYTEKKMNNLNYYYICEALSPTEFEVIFELQIPRMVRNTEKNRLETAEPIWTYNKWNSMAKEFIGKYFDELTTILPKYMSDICLEHNGIQRISEFPHLKVGFLQYNERCICVGADNEPLQIGAAFNEKMDDDKFIEKFISGLEGDWNGLSF